MLLTHDEFSEFVSKTWTTSDGNFFEKSKCLSKAIMQWNFDVFGNIFTRKRRLLARIGGIQRDRDRSDNPFLIKLKAELTVEYETLRDHENIFWKQKYRDKWLQDGVRNTKFFHLATLVRRKEKQN